MNPSIRSSCVSLAAALLAGAACLAAPARAGGLPDVPGTTWLLKGSATLKSPQLGGGTVHGYLLTFLEADGDVVLEDEAGYQIFGTWQLDGEGQLQILVTENDMEDFLENNLPPASIQDLVVTKHSSKTKLKVKDGIGTLIYKLSFTLEFTIDDEPHTLTYKLAVSGQHDVSGVEYPGSQWSLDGDLLAKAKKVKLTAAEEIKLVLGPAAELADDRFSIRRLSDDVELYGGYYVLVNGKVAMLPDVDAVETYFTDWIGPEVAATYPGSDLTIFLVRPKFSAKIKNGVLALNCKAQVFGSIDTPAKDLFFKGKHTLKGAGGELP